MRTLMACTILTSDEEKLNERDGDVATVLRPDQAIEAIAKNPREAIDLRDLVQRGQQDEGHQRAAHEFRQRGRGERGPYPP